VLLPIFATVTQQKSCYMLFAVDNAVSLQSLFWIYNLLVSLAFDACHPYQHENLHYINNITAFHCAWSMTLLSTTTIPELLT